MESSSPRLDGRGWALLVALATLWAGSFIFIKVAAAELPPFTLLRVGLAALVLYAVIFVRRGRYPTDAAILSRYLVMGFFNNALPFTLIVYATAKLGAGSASILNATTPLFALIVAHIATADEKITRAKFAGIVLGVAGVAAMAGPQAVAGLTGDLLAVGAMLLAALGYGISTIYGRRFQGIDPTVSAACQLTAATLLLLPLVLIVDAPWTLPAPGALTWLSVAALAVLSTALAYIIYWALIARAGGTNTSLVTLLIPVGGVFFAWALLGEAFSPPEAAGMALIGMGLVVMDGRLVRRIATRSRRSAAGAKDPRTG